MVVSYNSHTRILFLVRQANIHNSTLKRSSPSIFGQPKVSLKTCLACDLQCLITGCQTFNKYYNLSHETTGEYIRSIVLSKSVFIYVKCPETEKWAIIISAVFFFNLSKCFGCCNCCLLTLYFYKQAKVPRRNARTKQDFLDFCKTVLAYANYHPEESEKVCIVKLNYSFGSYTYTNWHLVISMW